MITPRIFFKLFVPQTVFRIHLSRYPMSFMVGLCSLINWTAAGVQQLFYGRRIRETKLEHPPIFILGHWRSGTTLLHELLALDSQLAFPSNYDTFTTRHTLVTRWLMYPLLSLLLPGRRPMDNMSLNAGSPQEDDFALISLGAPTPYFRVAFPNSLNRLHEQLDSDNLSRKQRSHFTQSLKYFFQVLTLQHGKRLLLKSPPHTGRIKMLADLFPGAKFIHISRDPMRMVPSTHHLWRAIDEVQSFQVATYDDAWLRNYVNECKDFMYQSYFRGREQIAPEQLVEIQFEELLAHPEKTIRTIYDQFQLAGVDELAPRIAEYFEQKKNHKLNRLEVPEKLKQDIRKNWQDYMLQFGYSNQPEQVF